MTTTFLSKLNSLPVPVQKEAIDYIEFLIQKYSKSNKKTHPKAGCMKGTFKIKDDFNEPLEDFKDYM